MALAQSTRLLHAIGCDSEFVSPGLHLQRDRGRTGGGLTRDDAFHARHKFRAFHTATPPSLIVAPSRSDTGSSNVAALPAGITTSSWARPTDPGAPLPDAAIVAHATATAPRIVCTLPLTGGDCHGIVVQPVSRELWQQVLRPDGAHGQVMISAHDVVVHNGREALLIEPER